MKTTLGKLTIKTRRRRKFVDRNHEGKIIARGVTAEEAGTRTGELEIEIDLDALLRTKGVAALESKGRRAVMQHGAIVIRVKKGTETETTVPHVHDRRCVGDDGNLICGCSDVRGGNG